MSLHHNTERYPSQSPLTSSQNERACGFTLLELLIALAILSVLFTVVTATFGAALRSMNTFETRSQVFHSSRVAFSLFMDELQSAVLPTSSQEPHFVGISEASQTMSLDRISFDSYNFRRFPGSLPGTDPVTFDWWIEDEAIMHRESPTLFGIVEPLDIMAGPRPYTHLDFTSGIFPLTDNVQNFRLRYHDGTQWVNQWSSQVKSQLPRAVSIELTLQLPDNGDQKFSTFISLPRGNQEAF